MKNHNYFGNMKVGTIVDCLSFPSFETETMRAAVDTLVKQHKVDLVISNQASKNWGMALTENGLVQGPSNYVLALSKALAKLLEPIETKTSSFHINRADGDGPIHL